MAPELTQAELTAFEDAGDPLAGVELPDRGVQWREGCVQTPNGLTVVSYEDAFEYPDGYFGANVAGFVVGNAEEYLAEHANREVEIPATYTQFDEFETVMTEVTCSVSGYGFGISRDRMEGAIRFATGGGRYSVDDLRAVVCDDGRMIVRAPAGTFVVAPDQIPSKPEGFTPECRTVAGMEVPEHNEVMLSGIERLVEELAKHADLDVIEHVARRNGGHQFATTSGMTFTVSGLTLRNIQNANPESEILDTHEYETMWGETFEYEPAPDELAERVGEKRFADDVCIGHEIRWEDPRIGSRFGTDSPLYFDVVSYYLPIPEDGDHIRISDSTRRIAEFETEGDGTEHPELPDAVDA